MLLSVWERFENGVWYKASSFSVILNFPPVPAAVNHLENTNSYSSSVQGLIANKKRNVLRGANGGAILNNRAKPRPLYTKFVAVCFSYLHMRIKALVTYFVLIALLT